MNLFSLLGLEKLIVKIKNIGIIFGNNNRIGDVLDLTHKTRADIRALEILESEDFLRVQAIYVDGVVDDNFEGFWYGWQTAPNSRTGMIWTPLGKNNKIKIPNNFTEISVWTNRQDDDRNASNNTHTSFSCRIK